MLTHIKCESNTIRDRQWITIQLPDIRNFSVPIRIAKMSLAARLTDGEKDPLDDLSDDEKKKDEKFEIKKKKKLNSIDIMEVFATNPPPMKTYSLETNSSTLAFSNNHLLLHDNKKLILFDLTKQIYQLEWDDNDYGKRNIIFKSSLIHLTGILLHLQFHLTQRE
jgi:hypothetical protein